MSSPDGSPPILIKPALTTGDLKLPTKPRNKRKAELQPEGPAPLKKSPKPARATTPKVASPAIKNPPTPEPNHKCDVQDCNQAFASENALAVHHKQHEREAEKQREEAGRTKFKTENPIEYTLASIAGALHLNRDGAPKSASTPHIKSGTMSVLPSKSASPTQTKSSVTETPPKLVVESEILRQVPTPPTSFWDAPGSPMTIRQCFEGITEEISPLSTMDISLFTPAYTPEDSSSDEKANVAMNNSYDDWNPFGMKDVCGTEILEEPSWDSDATACPTKDSSNWGEINGVMMFVQ
jgi:hypothetical protein